MLGLVQPDGADTAAEEHLMVLAGDPDARIGEASDSLDPYDLSTHPGPALQPVCCIPLGSR